MKISLGLTFFQRFTRHFSISWSLVRMSHFHITQFLLFPWFSSCLISRSTRFLGSFDHRQIYKRKNSYTNLGGKHTSKKPWAKGKPCGIPQISKIRIPNKRQHQSGSQIDIFFSRAQSLRSSVGKRKEKICKKKRVMQRNIEKLRERLLYFLPCK